MKDKVLKILFIISFLPYVAILILGIQASFKGFHLLWESKTYGIEAFFYTVMLLGGILIPVLLVCFGYEYWYMTKFKENFSFLIRNIAISSVIGVVLYFLYYIIEVYVI